MRIRLRWMISALPLALAASLRAASSQEIEAAIARLEDDKFPERERAMLYLWEHGAEAEPLLRKALDKSGPEARMRGHRVLEAFEMGIRPDTPKEVLEQIYLFRDGDREQRKLAISKLAELRELRLLRRLVQSVQDEKMRLELRQLVGGQLKTALIPMLEQGKMDEARELLLEVAVDEDGMKNLAVFAWVRGECEQILREEEARPPDSPTAWHRQAWLLRAMDRPEDAAKLAEKHQVAPYALGIRSAAGDPVAFCQELLEREGIKQSETLGAELTKARLEGDLAKFQKALKDLKTWAENEKDTVERYQAIEVLLLNDMTDEAIALMPGVFEDMPFEIETFRGRYDKAFAVLGLEKKSPPFSPWAEQLAEKAKAKDETAYRSLFTLAAYQSEMGEDEEATRLFGLMADAFQEDENRALAIIGAGARAGLGAFVAEQVERAAKRPGIDLNSLLGSILAQQNSDRSPEEQRSELQRWWSFIQNRRPDWPQKQSVEILWKITQAPRHPKERFDVEDWLKAAKEAAITLDPKTQAEWLGLVYRAAQRHGLKELARAYLEEWAEKAPSTDNMRALAEQLAEETKWEEAAAAYGKAWQRSRAVRQNIGRQNLAPVAAPDPSLLYLQSWALGNAGKKEEATRLRLLARLLPLGDSRARSQLAGAMALRGEPEDALREWRIIARLADENDSLGNSARYLVAERIADENPEGAWRLQERAVLGLLRADWGFSSTRYYLSYRARALQWKAKALAKAGKTEEALATVEQFYQSNPGNASIAELILPMLDEMGRGDKAQEYYEKTLVACQTGAEIFPKSAMMHNNLAWLHARAARRLDQALSHAEKAMELSPDTPAYIDTLAEVYFAKGNREKAVELSTKAVDLSPIDVELRTQLRRFKEAPMPKRE